MSGAALGLLSLALVVAATVLWFRLVRAVRIPRNRAGFLATWGGAALLGAIALARDPGWVGGAAAVLAILAGLLLVVLASVSRQKVEGMEVAVGAPLPELSGIDEHGEIFRSTELAGHPFLLKFFRGHW